MSFEANAIYPVSALQKNQREIREAAKEKMLHITENGASAYVFCSEEVLERTIARAVEEALYERECLEAIERGEEDIAQGRCVTGADALRKALADRRKRVA